MAVLLTTNHGNIKIELDAEKAPKTVANFIAYVEDGFYTNTIFHRVIDGFMLSTRSSNVTTLLVAPLVGDI